VADLHIDRQSAAYIDDPDTPTWPQPVGNSKSKEKGKRWVGMASVAFANSMSCLHVELMKYLGNESGDCSENNCLRFILNVLLTNIGHSTRWCCD
jgi:hypothetical protein